MTEYIISGISLPFFEEELNARRIAEKNLRRAGFLVYESLSLRKKSIDHRKKNDIRFVYSYSFMSESNINNYSYNNIHISAVKKRNRDIIYGKEKSASPVIIGMGPAGMFCALTLAENGYKPIIIERGENVRSRRKSVEKYIYNKVLNTESNVQFGAGGAGTFSDGKLTTRISDSFIRDVLKTFNGFGADDSILTEAKPHVGTDKLQQIVENIGLKLSNLGGKVIYNCKLTDFLISDKKITEIITTEGCFKAGPVVLATGNGAYDIYRLLQRKEIATSPKNYSVGFRIEHNRRKIDKAIFGEFAGDKRLGAASYNYFFKKDGLCAYTFCMCPGGVVIPSSSEDYSIITNGMSNSKRDGVNSNCALVVEIDKPGIDFRKTLENNAFIFGGNNGNAPIETVHDYLYGYKKSFPNSIQPTYGNGKNVTVADISKLFPENINEILRSAIKYIDTKLPGFAADDAIITAAETRTSAPVRIDRTEDCFSPSAENLYPCGEGAGYAGGITSSAVDGIKTAYKIMQKYAPQN